VGKIAEDAEYRATGHQAGEGIQCSHNHHVSEKQDETEDEERQIHLSLDFRRTDLSDSLSSGTR